MDFSIVTSLLTNIWFYISIIAVLVLGIIPKKTWKSVEKRAPVINQRNVWIAVGVGLLATFGAFSFISTGETASMVGNSAVTFDTQLTTAFSFNGSSLSGADINVMTDVRASEAQVAVDNQITAGILTITRDLADDSSPASNYDVEIEISNDFPDGYFPTAITYPLIERDTNGMADVFVSDGSAASVNDVRMTSKLTFAEGDSTATLGILAELDETGFGHLKQYAEKTVSVKLEGKVIYTLRIIKNDA